MQHQNLAANGKSIAVLLEAVRNQGSAMQPIRKTRLADEVTARLAGMILEGIYSPGEKLPPERELAAKLGVNRTSLREALRTMEGMGLISIRQGDGIEVKDVATESGLEFLKFILTTGLGLDKKLVMDMAEIRRLIAPEMIGLAAERADDEALQAIERVLKSYPRGNNPERFTGEHDFEFFREVAKATGNRVFVYMLNSIRGVFETFSGLYFRVEGDPDLAVDLYEKLLKAFKTKNRKRAVSLFKKRMEEDDKLLETLLEVLE